MRTRHMSGAHHGPAGPDADLQLQQGRLDYVLDVGANWNFSDRTQFYTRIDNVTNIRPPDTGSTSANNTLYDVIGRMYRVGLRFGI